MKLIETQTERAASKPSKVLPGPVLFWIIVVVSTSAVLILRRPDAVFHAQFWAEDGYVWYAQAYNIGALRALRVLYAGYLQILPRLAVTAALWVPLARAPLVLNLIALVIQALPAWFLVSTRMRNAGPLWLRCVLALLYVSVPNSIEIHATITDSQWHMAVLACLILIAEVPRSRAGQAFDVLVLVLCALTGPFCILLLPVGFVQVMAPLLARHSKAPQPMPPAGHWHWIQLSVLGAGGFVQGAVLDAAGEGRAHTTLGASTANFCRIVAGQIVLPLFQGRNRLDHMANTPARVTALACLATVVAALAVAYALWRGRVALRCFVFFALLVLVASLTFPVPAPTAYQWDPLLVPGLGLRYWYIPKLALMATLVWLLGRQRPTPIRVAAGVLACTMAFGMAKHWEYPALPDFHFAAYARQFEQLPSGASIQIPLNPGGPWVMTLVKK